MWDLSDPLSRLHWVEVNLWFTLYLSFGCFCHVDALGTVGVGLLPARAGFRLRCLPPRGLLILCLPGCFCSLPFSAHYFRPFSSSAFFFYCSHFSHSSYLWNQQDLAFINLTIPKCFFFFPPETANSRLGIWEPLALLYHFYHYAWVPYHRCRELRCQSPKLLISGMSEYNRIQLKG